MLDSRHFDVPRYLSLLPLFGGLDASQTARLAAGCQLQRLERGAMVFRQGDSCSGLHVVVTGQVKLFALSPTGQEKVIDLMGPGQSFGEALMFLGEPYVVSAQTLSDALLLAVGQDAVFDELQRAPHFARRMLAGLSRQLLDLVHDVQASALQSGVQRIIGHLLRDHEARDDSDSQPVTVSLPVSKATVASRLSVTPEYFSRVLHELEAQQLIEVHKRDIRIPSVRRLAAYQG